MRKYTPRRASKRWLEGAPDYVLDCFDNKGKTCDRYSVLIGGKFLYHTLPSGACAEGSDRYDNTYVQCLDMSGAPSYPQGVSMWGEMPAHTAANWRYHYKHHRVRWLDLPEHIRKHVIARAEE